MTLEAKLFRLGFTLLSDARRFQVIVDSGKIAVGYDQNGQGYAFSMENGYLKATPTCGPLSAETFAITKLMTIH
jgi:hypothetical protein